jgi:hypothetical protein
MASGNLLRIRTNRGPSPLPVEEKQEPNGYHSSEATISSSHSRRKSWLDSPITLFYALVIGAAISHFYGFKNLLSSGSDSRCGLRSGCQSPNQELFISGWMEHILSHPVQPSDRFGFAEMGLRTRVYARLLEAQSVSAADNFETRLWPFAPGAKKMRLAHFGPEPPLPAWPISEGESKLVKQVEPTLRMNAESLTSAAPQVDEAAHLSTDFNKERGIVMSLGRSQLRFAMHFLSILRKVYKSQLPVELYYYGDDDLPEFMRAYLETSYEGVRTVDLEGMNVFDDSIARLSRAGWALKPFALLATNFSEVILADADVVFLTNPEEFFEVEGYKETGTLFFHDRDHYREGASKVTHDFLADQLGNHGPSDRLKGSSFWQGKGIYEQESGIVVVDKRSRAAFSALFFAAWQNTGSIRERTTYRVFWGDKETYWLAFELSGIPYYFVEHYAGGLGNEADDGQFCSDHPLHFLPESTSDGSILEGLTKLKDGEEVKKGRPGRPAWFNGSLLKNKGLSGTKFIEETEWAVDDKWIFLEDLERWCLPSANYSGSSLGTLGRETIIAELVDTAREADDALHSLEAFLV